MHQRLVTGTPACGLHNNQFLPAGATRRQRPTFNLMTFNPIYHLTIFFTLSFEAVLTLSNDLIIVVKWDKYIYKSHNNIDQLNNTRIDMKVLLKII